MKLTIETKALRDAIHRIANLPGAAGAIIYTMIVRMTADMSGLTVRRFSNIASLSFLVDDKITIEDEGEVQVSFEDLAKYVAQMPGEKIAIFTHKEHVYLSSGNFKAKMSEVKDETAYGFTDDLEVEEIRMPIDEFHRRLASVAPAMHKEEFSKGMHGVAIKTWRDRVHFLASDSKIALIRSTEFTNDVDCVIPYEAVDMIVKATAEQTGKCILWIGEKTLRIEGSKVDILTQLLENTWINPDVLNTGATSQITKLALQVTEASKSLRSVARAANKVISVAQITEKEMKVSVEDATNGVQVKIPCSADKPVEIRINPDRFAAMLDFLNPDKSGNVVIEVFDSITRCTQDDRISYAVLSRPPKKE
jgi:DNA polymerase III sliding clamp (beta) subunit (PCNA family)